MDINNHKLADQWDDNADSLREDTILTGDGDNRRLMEEYAFARMMEKSKSPDVGKEWNRFRTQHIRRTAGRSTSRLIWIWSAAAVMIMGVMTAFFLFQQKGLATDHSATLAYVDDTEYIVKDNGTIIAFQANDAPKTVMFGCSRHDMHPIEKEMECDNVKAGPEKAVVCPWTNLTPANKTISTPRGGTYEITLADGTTVMLNADSRLTFPTAFTGKERTVKLVGEAFFKVRSDKEHPFIVQTPRMTTTVLGTEFDVKDYEDMAPEVTLVSGSVRVKSKIADQKDLLLEPDRYVRLVKGYDLAALKCDARQRTRWTAGYFSYSNAKLLTVLKDMGRWYNVDIELTDTQLDDYPVSLEISRSCTLDEFADTLTSLGFLSIKHEGGKMIFSLDNHYVPAVKLVPVNEL